VSTGRKSQASVLAACARRNARHDDCVRCGAGCTPASSKHLARRGRRHEDAEAFELADDPLVFPVWVLPSESQGQLAEGARERRSPRRPVRVGPAAGDELAVPAQQRLRLEREDCPGGSGQRAAQRRKQCTIRRCQPWPRGLPTENRQLMAKDKDLQLLRPTRPPQQPHEREQVPDDEIYKRPEQATLPRRTAEPEPSQLQPRKPRDEFANPTRS
jgi:hypothetical protein